MNVLGTAVLLLSGCNPRQEPQTPSSEFWPDPSAKAEVYLQSNCQIQASDSAVPNQLAFNEQLPRSGVTSAFGWCAAMQWERPRCSSGDPKGVLAYAFSLITQMHSRFSCWCPPDLLTYWSWQFSVLADNPKANAISHISCIWFPCRLPQDDWLCYSNRDSHQSVQSLGYSHCRFHCGGNS